MPIACPGRLGLMRVSVHGSNMGEGEGWHEVSGENLHGHWLVVLSIVDSALTWWKQRDYNAIFEAT